MSKKATKKQDNYALAYEPKKRLTENQKLKSEIKHLTNLLEFKERRIAEELGYRQRLQNKCLNLEKEIKETLRVAEIRLKQCQDLTEILLNHSRNDHFSQMLETGKILSTELLTKS